jgi:hypothetical protein
MNPWASVCHLWKLATMMSLILLLGASSSRATDLEAAGLQLIPQGGVVYEIRSRAHLVIESGTTVPFNYELQINDAVVDTKAVTAGNDWLLLCEPPAGPPCDPGGCLFDGMDGTCIEINCGCDLSSDTEFAESYIAVLNEGDIIRLVLDPGNQVGETNEVNNEFEMTFSVVPATSMIGTLLLVSLLLMTASVAVRFRLRSRNLEGSVGRY